ncbi:hypothetical protein BH10CHL1_BH10CHL1_14920 [soil metagenome]
MTTSNSGQRSTQVPTSGPLEPSQHATNASQRRPQNDPPQGYVGKPPSTNLILPRSALLGRDHELAAVQQLLLHEEIGLLTLTGPGGIGKTRLAMQVAFHLLDHFVDGVYFVTLAPIRDPALVSMALAQTLQVRETAGQPLQESLQDYLRDKQLLLVLDNFEQVVAAAPLVGTLLGACRRLKVLVTSRAPLHLYGEHEFPVPPLPLPTRKGIGPLGLDGVTSLAQSAAVTLFVQRAMAVQPTFTLTATNAATVAEICINLDGLPLAIELAASRIKLFSPTALLTRLHQRLTLLTGGAHDLPARQRTLRDAIAWSYDLLTADEQALFRRLAVFVGGFTLDAAQAVVNGAQDLAIDVLDGVAKLVDHNLLKRLASTEDEPRFGMLETIHEYGLTQLEANGETETMRHHHARFFLAWAEAMAEMEREQARMRSARELDNIRAVMAWTQTLPSTDDRNGGELGLQLAGALIWFAFFWHNYSEMRGWLAASRQPTVAPTAIRAKALWGIGVMAMTQGDFQHACRDLEASVALWRTIGDPSGLAAALRELCVVARAQGQFIAAQRYGEESVALYRALGRQGDLALALDNLGITLANQGDQLTARQMFEEELSLYQTLGQANQGTGNAFVSLGWIAGQQGEDASAIAFFEKALLILRAVDDKWTSADTLNLLGEVRQRQGALEQAGQQYAEGLVMARAMGDKAYIAHILHNLARLALTQAEPARAVRLAAVADALWAVGRGNVFRALVTPSEQKHWLSTLRTTLDPEKFAVWWAEGQAMQLDQAIAYALAMPTSSVTIPLVNKAPSAALSSLYPAGLTAREVEVLRLLVQGLTYQQIADTLIISRRTVNSHATTIYGKLGVTSRAAAMRLALDHHFG